jgi:RNA polymerase sigma factor (sigma-70 family)
MGSPTADGSAVSIDTLGHLPASATSVAKVLEMASVLEEARPRLLALAYSVLRDRDLACDAVQDTMERAVRAWTSVRSPAKRGAWLATICFRRSLRLHRTEIMRSRLRVLHGEVSVELVTSDVDLESAIAKLPTRQRAILALHYVHGFSLDESAEVLGVRPGTVRSHLSRALRKLREELEQ